jgi:hypothetical protein
MADSGHTIQKAPKGRRPMIRQPLFLDRRNLLQLRLSATKLRHKRR